MAAAAANAARDGQTALALRLAKHLAPASPGAQDSAAFAAAAANKNVAFSPVSVHAALALTAAGARGATLAQLLAFLGAPSTEELADFGRRVADRVLADRSGAGGPRVLFGGGVWVDAARGGLTDAFRDVAAEAYKSEATTVSFTDEPEAAVKMINEWVKKATDNIIDSIVSTSDINADTDLVLANVVYFKGEWMKPFVPLSTWRGGPRLEHRLTFHLLDGGHVVANFMGDLRRLDVACMDGFKVVKLPYKPGDAEPGGGQPARGGQLKRRRGQVAASESKATPPTEANDNESTQYSMFFFLPDARDGLSTMVDMVTASPTYLYGILAEMKERHVIIELPRFAITFSWGDLKGDLGRLGLSLPFLPEAADLRGMCKGDDDGDQVAAGAARRPTFLSKVAHTAVVKVDEEGTEAAAVCAGLRSGGGPPPDLVQFTADHPFTFFIMEERSGVIVFAGHVLDPTK